tara:strand:+ start:94 stop:252 length:159 start_codon:yes stop_codon:yes gene_type:complete
MRSPEEWRAMLTRKDEAIIDRDAEIKLLKKYVESLQVLLDENGVHWTVMEEE